MKITKKGKLKFILSLGTFSATIVSLGAIAVSVASCGEYDAYVKDWGLNNPRFGADAGTQDRAILSVSYNYSGLTNKINDISKSDKKNSEKSYEQLVARYSVYKEVLKIINSYLTHDATNNAYSCSIAQIQLVNPDVKDDKGISPTLGLMNVNSIYSIFFGISSSGDGPSGIELSPGTDEKPNDNNPKGLKFFDPTDPAYKNYGLILTQVFNSSNPDVKAVFSPEFITKAYNAAIDAITSNLDLSNTEQVTKVKSFIPDLQTAILYWSLNQVLLN